jgi:DNA helicase-2/ATP-dependent DNA helicase PcrA
LSHLHDSGHFAGPQFSGRYLPGRHKRTFGERRAQANRNDATHQNCGSRSGHAVERIGYGETDSGYGAGRTSIKNKTIDGELVAKSVADQPSAYAVGDRVFHIKFGNGNVASIDGNKLTIDFDKAGQKRVLDNYVEKA